MIDLSTLAPVVRWWCSRCTMTDVTREARPHSRMHPCSGLGGLTAPMLREGERVKVEVNVREDYVGGDDVQYDGDGRPIMSIVTTRDDGTDAAVYAPCAHNARS